MCPFTFTTVYYLITIYVNVYITYSSILQMYNISTASKSRVVY